jgi:glycosyltransferase involved in cell wall biosynthesis
MDLFLLNSIREGLPNVVLEAMALEVPVVATRVAGVPALIRPGQTGWLIEPQDPAMLDNSVLDCLEGTRTNQFVQNARLLIESDFSFDRRMKKVASIYDAMSWKHS